MNWLSIITWLLMVSTAAAAQNSWPSQYVAEQMATLRVPGAALVIIDGDKPVFMEGFGLADIEERVPVGPDTVFRVGSNSKPVTASAALLLASKYSIDLQSDLRPYLSDMPVRPQLDKPLTLHHLLSHTAGFNESLFGQHRSPPAWTPLKTYLKNHLTPRFIEPGEIISYVDFHTALAGLIIEEVSGQSFQTFTEKELFEPLGMTTSTFRQIDVPEEIKARRAKSYRDAGGEFIPYAFDAIETTPAAGLYTSARDMSLYLKWLLQGWRGEADTPSVNAAIKTQLTIQARNHPALDGRAYGFAERTYNGWRVLYKDGQATGFNARLLIVPEADIAFFIVHNANILAPGGGFTGARRLIRDFTEEFLAQNLTEGGAIQSIDWPETLPAFPLEIYAGHYRTTVASRHTWEKLTAIFDTVDVRVENGKLLIGGRASMPVGDHLFADVDHKALRAFRVVDGRATHIFFGSSSYERASSFEKPMFAAAVTIVFCVGFVSLAIAGFLSAGGGVFGWTSSVAPMLCIVFVAGFFYALFMTDPQLFFHGMTPALKAVLVLPPIALAIALLEFSRSFFVKRSTLSIVSLVMVAVFCGWLAQWNLLGWQVN